MDTIKYLYKKSSDGKYVWITKVEVSDKHTSNQLKFPEKINESILVCVGFDSDNRVKTHQMLHTMCLEIRLWMAMIFNIRKQ